MLERNSGTMIDDDLHFFLNILLDHQPSILLFQSSSSPPYKNTTTKILPTTLEQMPFTTRTPNHHHRHRHHHHLCPLFSHFLHSRFHRPHSLRRHRCCLLQTLPRLHRHRVAAQIKKNSGNNSLGVKSSLFSAAHSLHAVQQGGWHAGHLP